MDLLEGGIRVPYIACWPGRLPKGKTDERLAITMDWTATFLAAAGVAPHPDYPMDGIDLLKEGGERNLYWRMKFRHQKAMRAGNWKYLSIEGNEFLYDLSLDPRERANMKMREPARFEKLKADYAKWEASVPPVPPDAKVSLVYGPAEMAKPS
jgi:arylsulfatase A-like enzyme